MGLGRLAMYSLWKRIYKTHTLAPFWNTMNILTTKNGKESPHFITAVSDFAKSSKVFNYFIREIVLFFWKIV